MALLNEAPMTPRTNSRPGRSALIHTITASVSIQGLTLASGAIAARILGPEGRGALAAAILWPTVIAGLGLFGLNHVLSLYAAKNDDVRDVMHAALLFTIIASMIAIPAGWILLPFVLPHQFASTVAAARLFLLFVPLNVLTTHIQAIELGRGRLRNYNITRVVLSGSYLVMLGVFWLCDIRAVGAFVVALLSANLITLLVRIVITGQRSFVPYVPLQYARRLLQQAAPFFLSSVLFLAQGSIDRALLLWFLAERDLGLFAVAASAGAAQSSVSASVRLLVFARGAAVGSVEAMTDGARVFRLMALAGGAMSLCLGAALPILIPLVFGHKFRESVVPAVLIVVTTFLQGQGQIIDETLRSQSKPTPGVYARVIGLAAFASLGAFLARAIGLIGVAVAGVVNQAIFLIFLMIVFRRQSPARLAPRFEDVKEFRIYRSSKRERAALQPTTTVATVTEESSG